MTRLPRLTRPPCLTPQQLGAHLRHEFLILLRIPAFTVPSVLYPLLMYLFFGLPVDGGPRTTSLVAVVFCAFALLGIVLFDFGIGFASRRGTGWETYLRTLPSDARTAMTARLLVAIPFGVVAMVPILVVAGLGHRLALDWGSAGEVAVALALGVVPFACLGVVIGHVLSARTAAPMATLIYLPLAYLGGMFQAPGDLPKAFADVSQWLPTRMWRDLLAGAAFGRDYSRFDVVGLAAYGVLLLVAAWYAVRREAVRIY